MFSSLLALVLLLTFSSLFGTITFAYFFFTCVCSNCQPQKTKISPDRRRKEQWFVGSCVVTITNDMPQVNQFRQMSPSHQQGRPALCTTRDSWTAFPPLISSETTRLQNKRILLSFATPERLGKVDFCEVCKTSYGSTNPIRPTARETGFTLVSCPWRLHYARSSQFCLATNAVAKKVPGGVRW